MIEFEYLTDDIIAEYKLDILNITKLPDSELYKIQAKKKGWIVEWYCKEEELPEKAKGCAAKCRQIANWYYPEAKTIDQPKLMPKGIEPRRRTKGDNKKYHVTKPLTNGGYMMQTIVARDMNECKEMCKIMGFTPVRIVLCDSDFEPRMEVY